VWVRLYYDRIGEMRSRRIRAQALATSRDGQALQRISAADNFRNLFEVPVLFYALCIALAATGTATTFFVAGAWAYVALRALHSFIHVTYNRVMHRFTVYVLSTVLLFAMWGVFGVQTIRGY
jgi:hypothetical protein